MHQNTIYKVNVLCHIRPFHLLNEVDFMQSLPYNVDSLPFAQTMSYTANGKITRKATNARILNGNHITTKSNDFGYSYAGGGNKVSAITDGTYLSGGTTLGFRWDNCGNLLSMEVSSNLKGQNMLRTHTWTEDNRLQTVADNSWFSYYQYDAAGDRTYKLTWSGSVQTVNGRRDVYYTPQSATLYASPYLVATPQGYTKHYYAEAERITSQLGRGKFDGISTPVVSDSLVQAKLQAVTNKVRYPVTLSAPSASYFAYLDTLTNRQNDTFEAYWYNTDHLGSSSWITYSDGSAVQHLHYLPWGEDFVNQRLNDFEGVRFTFSAKEKDTETGYSYFGSRYYSSDLSIWLSVDPMSDKYPSFSPYVYCANNPIKLVDPNGEENVYAFHYAQRRLLNKVGSVYDISTQSWYGYGPGQHRYLTQQDPDKESCYGIIWHAYMNSGDKITSYLQTGFSNKNNSFKGRYSAKAWFQKGNDTPANEDGLSRSFETDIMKGEIGDIVFMEGHAAMLAGIPEQIEEDGNTYVKLKVFTSTSNSGFIEQDIVFDANNKNRTGGWSGFEGYGQLHQTHGKGDPKLE